MSIMNFSKESIKVMKKIEYNIKNIDEMFALGNSAKQKRFLSKNQIVVGENSAVLSQMNRYFSNVYDLVYIDAPYNTGSEHFVGQTYTNRHKDWEKMIKDRFMLMKPLIKDTGFIVMSIDDAELISAKETLNDVFGENNFFATFVWQRRNYVENEAEVSTQHEYFLVYKNTEKAHPTRMVSTYILPEKISSMIPQENGFQYLTNEYQDKARKEVNDLLEMPNAVNNYPKPVDLLKNLFAVFLPKETESKVLDIFCGSGTTGESISKLNQETGTNATFTLVQMSKEKVDKVYKSVENLAITRVLVAAQKYESKHQTMIYELVNK